jgi:hypothetical protein
MFSARALDSTALECRLCTKRTPTDSIPGPPSVKPGGGLLVFVHGPKWAQFAPYKGPPSVSLQSLLTQSPS